MPVAHAAKRSLNGSGSSSPLSTMSASTCSAIALALRTAASGVAPYAITPGRAGTAASQRPSSSFSVSTCNGWISAIRVIPIVAETASHAAGDRPAGAPHLSPGRDELIREGDLPHVAWYVGAEALCERLRQDDAANVFEGKSHRTDDPPFALHVVVFLIGVVLLGIKRHAEAEKVTADHWPEHPGVLDGNSVRRDTIGEPAPEGLVPPPVRDRKAWLPCRSERLNHWQRKSRDWPPASPGKISENSDRKTCTSPCESRGPARGCHKSTRRRRGSSFWPRMSRHRGTRTVRARLDSPGGAEGIPPGGSSLEERIGHPHHGCRPACGSRARRSGSALS